MDLLPRERARERPDRLGLLFQEPREDLRLLADLVDEAHAFAPDSVARRFFTSSWKRSM